MGTLRRLAGNVRSSCRATVFRLRYGFWPSEYYNLDGALAEWLIPRIRFLATHGIGAPHGYPNKPTSFDDATDFDQWSNDLLWVANALQEYLDVNNTDGWTLERENEANEEAQRAMQWIADNFSNLWD